MAGKNIIQKQIIALEMNSTSNSPFELQAQTSRWCNEILIPAIHKKLEKYAQLEEVIRLENISIDMIDSPDLLTESFAEKIAKEIESYIKNKVESVQAHNNTFFVSKERSTVEAFLFFLQNAYLPWWYNIKSVSEIDEKELLSLTGKELTLLKELMTEPSIRKRLVNVLTSEIAVSVCSLISGKEKHNIKTWMENIRLLSLMIDNKDLEFQFLTWSKQEYIYNLLQDADEIQMIKSIVRKLMDQYKIRKEIIQLHLTKHLNLKEKEVEELFALIKLSENEHLLSNELESPRVNNFKKEEQKTFLKKEGIYINNSGLVLLAPFLPRFFENLGIIEEGRFNSKDLALALLHWLATGNDEYEETDLVLPKILCGMEPEDSVIIIPYLPESFKNEGDNLLQSVIEHWEILKNTSIEGLREGFLQRDGKLSFHQNEWLLQVEQKPYDMLLEHLPWNISMIRLSWMHCLLKTEWVG